MTQVRFAGAYLLAGVVAACSGSSTETREIGGHRFEIPRKYLVHATIAYLPASQSRALRFVVNPEAPLPEQHMISIHPDASCPRMDKSEPIDARCRIVPIPLSSLQQAKLRRVGNDSGWEYRLESGQMVIFCSALEKGDGLCTHYGLYQGLPYRLGLRDSEIGKLAAIRRTVERKLAEWESAASR